MIVVASRKEKGVREGCRVRRVFRLWCRKRQYGPEDRQRDRRLTVDMQSKPEAKDTGRYL